MSRLMDEVEISFAGIMGPGLGMLSVRCLLSSTWKCTVAFRRVVRLGGGPDLGTLDHHGCSTQPSWAGG